MELVWKQPLSGLPEGGQYLADACQRPVTHASCTGQMTVRFRSNSSQGTKVKRESKCGQILKPIKGNLTLSGCQLTPIKHAIKKAQRPRVALDMFDVAAADPWRLMLSIVATSVEASNYGTPSQVRTRSSTGTIVSTQQKL